MTPRNYKPRAPIEYHLGKALAIFYDVAKRHNIDSRTMRDSSFRHRYVVVARKEFILHSRAAGLRLRAIATVLRMNHSSVYWHTVDGYSIENRRRRALRAYEFRKALCRAA